MRMIRIINLVDSGVPIYATGCCIVGQAWGRLDSRLVMEEVNHFYNRWMRLL